MHIPCALRKFSGGQTVLSLPTGDGRTILDRLAQDCPSLYCSIADEHGGLQPFVKMFVNKAMVSGSAASAARAREGDVIDLVSAVAGG
jgi:hypothetical protein